MRELLYHRGEVLSGLRFFCSESVVSHLVSRVSFCGVFVLCWLGSFCFIWKTPGFLLSPILQDVGIANLRQNVLMTVRASSVHGMSSKKTNFEHGLHYRFGHVKSMYRSSPFRSTLNTGYIAGLDMCKVCTEAVHSVAL